jgi:hypothetical protein
MAKPVPQRKLKAAMVLKDLSLYDVSRRAKVEYVRCSEILSGNRIDPIRLSKITKAIEDAPFPTEANI